MRASLAATGLFLLLLACQSCGGRTAAALGDTSSAVPMPGLLRSSLPAIPPAGHFLPQKMSSSVVADRNGATADLQQNMTVQGTSAVLTSGLNTAAYTLFRFAGFPGEAISTLGYSGSGVGAGEQVWVALADYSTGRWSFQPPQTLNAKSFNTDTTPGRYTSTGGDIYVLILVFGGTSFQLDTVSLTYSQRFSASGQVTDMQGTPLPGATVSTPAFGLSVVTDAQGNFTLPALPNGDWPVVATMDSWTFYDNPATASISGADASGITFRGHQNGSHFLPRDTGPRDDMFRLAQAVDLSAAVDGSLSIVDDADDYLSFTISTPGNYFLRISNTAGDILFPLGELLNPGEGVVASTYYALRGTLCIGLPIVTTPQDFVLHLSLSGGGGDYVVELLPGICHAMGGYVGTPGASGVPTENCVVRATPDTGSGFTEYLDNANGGYEDGFREPVSTTISVTAPGYSFSPATRSVNLATADRLGLDFVPTAPNLPDGLEPNDTIAAAPSLPMPYDSVAAGDDLSLSALDDVADIYQVNPAVGEGLVARITTAGGESDANALALKITDDAGNIFGSGVRTVDGWEVRLEQLSVGIDYFIVVSAGGVRRRYAYTLTAETYQPHVLYFECLLGSQPVQGAKIDLRDAAFTWKRQFTTSSAGTTGGIFLREGEQVVAELHRFGLDVDRQTRTFVTPPADTKLSFIADTAASADQYEPNNDLNPGGINLPALPATVSGTVDPLTDHSDFFRFFASVSQPVQASVQTPDGMGFVHVNIYNGLGAQIAKGDVAAGASLFFNTDGTPPYRLEVQDAGAPVEYTLTLQTGLAYKLTGKVTDGVAGMAARVYCVELDRWVDNVPFSGSYDFGLLPPGTYTVRAFAPGFTESADGTATITNANASVDLVITPDLSDADEPDDSRAQGTPLATNGTPDAGHLIGLSGDINDYFLVNATAGNTVELTVDWAAAWHPQPYLKVYDPDDLTVTTFQGGYVPRAVITFVAGKTGEYAVQIFGGPAGYGISALVQ